MEEAEEGAKRKHTDLGFSRAGWHLLAQRLWMTHPTYYYDTFKKHSNKSKMVLAGVEGWKLYIYANGIRYIEQHKEVKRERKRNLTYSRGSGTSLVVQ